MRSLAHGLRGPRGHGLGLRVTTQWSHDWSSDGGRAGVALLRRLNDDKYVFIKNMLRLNLINITRL